MKGLRNELAFLGAGVSLLVVGVVITVIGYHPEEFNALFKKKPRPNPVSYRFNRIRSSAERALFVGEEYETGRMEAFRRQVRAEYKAQKADTSGMAYRKWLWGVQHDYMEFLDIKKETDGIIGYIGFLQEELTARSGGKDNEGQLRGETDTETVRRFFLGEGLDSGRALDLKRRLDIGINTNRWQILMPEEMLAPNGADLALRGEMFWREADYGHLYFEGISVEEALAYLACLKLRVLGVFTKRLNDHLGRKDSVPELASRAGHRNRRYSDMLHGCRIGVRYMMQAAAARVDKIQGLAVDSVEKMRRMEESVGFLVTPGLFYHKPYPPVLHQQALFAHTLRFLDSISGKLIEVTGGQTPRQALAGEGNTDNTEAYLLGCGRQPGAAYALEARLDTFMFYSFGADRETWRYPKIAPSWYDVLGRDSSILRFSKDEDFAHLFFEGSAPELALVQIEELKLRVGDMQQRALGELNVRLNGIDCGFFPIPKVHPEWE